MKFSKNYYKYIIAVVFSLFVLSVNAREVCFDTPTSIKIVVPYCPPDTVCVTERIIIIHQCVTVPDEYTGPVTPPGSSPAPSGSVPPPYNELDNTRPPAPPCDSLATIEVNQAQCKVDLKEAFDSASDNCGAFGGTSAALAIAAGAVGAESKNKWVKGVAYSIAGLAALSTELFATSCPSQTHLDTQLLECDLRAAQHKQGCGY